MKTTPPIFCRRAVLAVILCAFLTSARAQDRESNPLTLEPLTITVTVTAQKEPEPANSVPLSVTPVTKYSLMDGNIQSVKPAAAYAPNSFINEFTARALSNPYFRGIGGSPTNPGVSTVIDGVPQLNGYSSNIEFIDVDQLEFVRGPEGALYGRNTAGGLINITSRSLSNSWTVNGQGDFGSYNRRDMRASASSPLLNDRFGIVLAGGYSGRDGYTKNSLTEHDLDSRSASFGKGQFFFKASDRLQIRLIISGERDRDGDYALGDLGAIRKSPHSVARDFEGFNNRSVGSATLVADYRGGSLDFSSITGGLWLRNHGLTDLDYQTATLENYGLYAIRDNVEQQRQFTQEFRLGSPKDRSLRLNGELKLDWQAGVFVFNQRYQQDAANDISSAFGFFPQSVSTSSADLRDWGFGIYGQTRLVAWQKLDVMAGVRLDYEDKHANLESLNAPAARLKGDFSEASPRFSVAYHFNADHMGYASVSRGYKAGGFNPAPAGIPAPAGTERYGPEHTWNYEIGHKAKWLENKLETTVALFYIDWKNLQLNQQIPFSGGQYYIGNAGRANSKGIEFEANVRPVSWWNLFGSVGYTHARFLSGSSAFNANLGLNQAVAGNTLPYTPTFTANVGTQVSWSLNRLASLYFRAQLTGSGEFQYDASNAMSQTRYQLVNFRAGVRARHIFAEGWVDNAFDTHYVPIAIPYAQLGAPSGYVGESGAPVTYGARAGLSF